MKKFLICVSIIVFMIFIKNPTFAHELPILNSESAVLINAKTGEVLFEKNSNTSMYPASITKIVTAILAIEEGNLEDIVTVSENARNVIGTRVYLLEGEKVPLKKLVQGLLINSGNDAGTAIAEFIDGSEEAFAERMNHFVTEQIGVSNTTFKNPHGLYHPEHKTTAIDMAKITQYAMKNNIFRGIAATKELEWIGEGWETTLYNHNKLLWRYDGVNGVKNGFVSQSGFTLVTSAIIGDMELIAVTLKANTSENAYADTVKLLDFGFNNFEMHNIPAGSIYEDQFGNVYRLAKNIIFSTELEEQWSTEVFCKWYIKNI